MEHDANTPLDAIVLRVVRYGESDLVVHLMTLQQGRLHALAKGARSRRSRVGARLEAMSVLTIHVRQGRGDLAFVRSVEHVRDLPNLRASYRLQRIAACALDAVGRASVDGEANPALFHLAVNFLHILDQRADIATHQGDDTADQALVAAFQLKLAVALGITPQLHSCVRCGSTQAITAISGGDGGVVCASCRSGADAPLADAVRTAAVTALASPLVASTTDDVDVRNLARAGIDVAARLVSEHAGFRLMRI